VAKRKIVETFKQTYRKGCFVDDVLLKWRLAAKTNLPPLAEGAAISDVELKAAGHCEMDGKKREFVDLRIYLVP
jgi:hypothetical protein